MKKNLDPTQKEDAYKVSKQPMPVDPMMAEEQMGMGITPMPSLGLGAGQLPPTPMPPQEEELEAGESYDPTTGKIRTRGEQFKVDPNDEPDDVKRQDTIGKSDWFNKLRK
tara:strand:+ start:791 stop:1120 length:330 start_codon:yes stop_codon:yes gene_type:complete